MHLNMVPTMDLEDEKKLVEAAKTDTESFARLYDLYFPRIYAFVLSKTNNQEAAEDLVSDIFMKVVKALPRFEWRDVPFAAWLFRIARNRLNDYYREFAKHNTSDIENVKESHFQDENLSPKTQASQNELSDAVKALLSQLPEREASALRLKFFVGLSNKEIASTLGITESNVGVIIFRSLKTLKPDLEHFF